MRKRPPPEVDRCLSASSLPLGLSAQGWDVSRDAKGTKKQYNT